MKMQSLPEDEKNVSQIFAHIRAQLQLKERQLLEFQRQNGSFLAVDREEISRLLDSINSLHLSTEDGSFVFENDCSKENDQSTRKFLCPSGIEEIKNLPLSIWLNRPTERKEMKQKRISSFEHLLSIPIENYRISPNAKSSRKRFSRSIQLPMINYLFTLPPNAFKPAKISSSSTSTNSNIKSLLQTEKTFAKEFWVKS